MRLMVMKISSMTNDDVDDFGHEHWAMRWQAVNKDTAAYRCSLRENHLQLLKVRLMKVGFSCSQQDIQTLRFSYRSCWITTLRHNTRTLLVNNKSQRVEVNKIDFFSSVIVIFSLSRNENDEKLRLICLKFC